MKRDIISKCLIMVFVFFSFMCTVNHVLKTSRLPLLCTVKLIFCWMNIRSIWMFSVVFWYQVLNFLAFTLENFEISIVCTNKWYLVDIYIGQLYVFMFYKAENIFSIVYCQFSNSNKFSASLSCGCYNIVYLTLSVARLHSSTSQIIKCSITSRHHTAARLTANRKCVCVFVEMAHCMCSLVCFWLGDWIWERSVCSEEKFQAVHLRPVTSAWTVLAISLM